MAVALVDSNLLIGLANRRDQDHERAREIMSGIDASDLPTARLTNYVIGEAMNYIHARQHHEAAVDLYDRLKAGKSFEFVHATRGDFARAEELFHRYGQLSFVDSTLVAYMRREGIEYLYSFDDDFDAIDDVTRFGTAVDPYR